MDFLSDISVENPYFFSPDRIGIVRFCSGRSFGTESEKLPAVFTLTGFESIPLPQLDPQISGIQFSDDFIKDQLLHSRIGNT